MDGLCRCLAPNVSVRLNGRTFRIRPLRLRDIAGLELEVLVSRKSPVDLVVDQAEALKGKGDVGREIFNRAATICWNDKSTRVWKRTDFNEWFDGSGGIAWSFFRMLYKGRKRAFKSMKDVIGFVGKCTPVEIREFVRRRDMANGTDILSTLEWPCDQAEGGGKYMLWKRAIRFMASEYGWGPEEVGKLTLWQLKLYTADESQLGGVTRIAASEAGTFMAARRNPFERKTKDHPARRHVRKMVAEQAMKKAMEKPLKTYQRQRPVTRPSQVPLFRG